MLANLHFLRPYWLAALPVLGLLLWRLWRRRAEASIWFRLVDPHLLAHLLEGDDVRPRRWPLVLLGLGWLILVLALAGPVLRKLPQPVFDTNSQRVILLDLSPSMNAADMAPSRLARARFEILDLLAASGEGQVGLIAFGPEPFLVSPLSGDARTIAAQVPQLDTDLIPVPGARRTDLALEMAGALLERGGEGAGDLILVTDALGDRAAALEMARRLASAGRRLSVLAVATAKGAPVPSPEGGFAQDAEGGIQVARLDPAPLLELARAGHGRYLEATVGDRDTRTLIQASAGLSETVEKTALMADQWREEGPWLLLALLPLAGLAFRRGWLVPSLVLALLTPADPTLAFGWSDLWLRADQQGARQLAAGQAGAAAERFHDPAWRAAASYRAGDFERALESLSGLAGVEAEYNRGNALARLGRLQEAADAYESVLRQAPDHADARHNLELARKLLEQIKELEESSRKTAPNQSRTDDSKQNPADPSGQESASEGETGQKQEGKSAERAASAGKGEQESASSPEDGSPAGQASSDAEPAGDSARARGQTAGDSPAKETPNAGDFSQEALSGEPTGPGSDQNAGNQAGRNALAPGDAAKGEGEAAADQAGIETEVPPEARERQQALEAQLRRVPDDPAGLLRQRFLLQHLRREGRLP